MPRPPTVKTFREDGSCIMMCPTDVVDNRTYLPTALLCLFDEAIHMHRARKLIARVPRLVPLGCMVDGLFFMGPVDAKEELEAICEKECRYPLTLGEVYQFKSTVTWKDVPKCEQQLQGLHRDQEKPIFDVAWRNFVEGRVGNWLHEEDETAATDDAVLESMIRDEFDYEAVREEILAINPKLDHFQILATMAALNNGLAGQGAMVLGAAGVGKSEVLRTLRKLFDKRGFKTRVCAYTHSATRLVGGETVARLLHFNTELKDTVFFVDEVGLLPLSTLGQMSRWVELGARFFMFGDFEGQFEAWQDRWQFPSAQHENLPLMKDLCGFLKLTLTKYRRGVDQQLFDHYHRMYGKEDVKPLVESSLELYGPTRARCDPRTDPLILVISHSKRMIANARANALVKPADAEYLEWEGEVPKGTTMLPQSMWIWVGMTLIGCPRGSGKDLVVQGVLYHIKEITETSVKLQMDEEYTKEYRKEVEQGEIAQEPKMVEVPKEDVCSQLRMMHASCYYTVQGRTIRNRHIVLLDTSHPHFTTRALVVGLSRAEHGDFVHVGDGETEQAFLGERKARQRLWT